MRSSKSSSVPKRATRRSSGHALRSHFHAGARTVGPTSSAWTRNAARSATRSAGCRAAGKSNASSAPPGPSAASLPPATTRAASWRPGCTTRSTSHAGDELRLEDVDRARVERWFAAVRGKPSSRRKGARGPPRDLRAGAQGSWSADDLAHGRAAVLTPGTAEPAVARMMHPAETTFRPGSPGPRASSLRHSSSWNASAISKSRIPL
jgi:hypothetical protein